MKTNYPLDCWYVAATSDEVGSGLPGRKLLDRPVVLYRLESGEVVALVMEQAAALHADSGQKTQLAEVDWLKGTVASFTNITANFPQTAGTFLEKFGDLVPEADVQEAARLNDQLDAWKRVLNTPQCLWHSDLLADNLLFDAVPEPCRSPSPTGRVSDTGAARSTSPIT